MAKPNPYPESYGFAPDDRVRRIGTKSEGTVTYPGPRGIPERIYVHFAPRQHPSGRMVPGGTFHYHYTELEKTD